MKKIFAVILFVFFACSGNEMTISKDPLKNISNETQIDGIQINTGWNDNNTYIVQALGENISKAKQKARFQILKDIINVRVRKNSAYTDIEKVSNEFDTLFKNASIIKQIERADGVEIYYQIKEPGLKFKFEKN